MEDISFKMIKHLRFQVFIFKLSVMLPNNADIMNEVILTALFMGPSFNKCDKCIETNYDYSKIYN